jgi:hypothetical protein
VGSVEKTLQVRETRYGDFSENALYAQRIKEIMRITRAWPALQPFQREALELIASKIGRMLSGDPNYVDNWHDLAGYATLVEQRLGAEPCPADTTSSTKKPTKSSPPSSKSERSGTKPVTSSSEQAKSTKATGLISTIGIPSRRAARMLRRIGESAPATPTARKGI